MRRRRRQKRNETLKLAALAGVLVALIGGLGTAAWQAFGKAVPDKLGCYDGVAQAHTLVLIDASAPRFDADQARALRRYFAKLYAGLGFNERLSVYTSEGDQMASVLTPRFQVCGAASTPAQLEAIGAETGSPGYLKKQRQRLYEKVFRPQLDAVLAQRPVTEARRIHQSPLLEMVADLSRNPALGPGSRLVLVSDLIQNSESAQFCFAQNHMPRFSVFAKRRVYQSRLKPRSLEGVTVDVLMLQRGEYGPYCRDEEEIKAFWRAYFRANGVKSPRFIRIRHGRGG